MMGMGKGLLLEGKTYVGKGVGQYFPPFRQGPKIDF